MDPQPQIHQRSEQPYAGIRTSVTLAGFPEAADTLFPELFGWLHEHGVTPAGPPFIRYHVIDMMAELDVEFGVPVGVTVPESDRVRAGVLPPGRYVTLRHIGPMTAWSKATRRCCAGRPGRASPWTAGIPTTARPGADASSTTSPIRRQSPTRPSGKLRWPSWPTEAERAAKRWAGR